MLEVYDIETIKGLFTYSGYNITENKVYQFVIHKSKNQLVELVNHITSLEGMIGFNNTGFDYPVLHFILKNYREWGGLTNQQIVELIYEQAQEVIADSDRQFYEKQLPYLPEWEYVVQQLDLYKLWHFNNQARRTSLKALEIAMGMTNVMDMPIHHSEENISVQDIIDVLEYNLHDVRTTYKFYLKSLDKLNLRNQLNLKYNLKCINFPDSKIGESLLLKLYCDITKSDPKEINKLRTYRKGIKLSDCIFPYVKFKSDKFTEFLAMLKTKTIVETKGEITFSVIFKGFKYDYGTGGIHGCIKSGIYESDDDSIIRDADVGSQYPNLAIQNGLFPKHLGKVFCKIYKEDIVDVRLKAKKEGNMVLSDGFKLSANSVYGKSNDKYSFLYDPMYTMQTTMNGQLLLSMLAEELVLEIPGLIMLQINTDGLTVKIPKSYIEKYDEICKRWEVATKLNLEYVDYSKMIIRDVNNYMSVSTSGKVKYKGTFKPNAELIKDGEWHKDFSSNIVKLALIEFFFNNIPVEETIRNHRVILDFCIRQKFSKDSYGETTELRYDNNGNPFAYREKQQKNVRYYISKSKTNFFKKYISGKSKGKTAVINKGFSVTIFNTVVKKEWNDYLIDYDFYIKECYKEIHQIKSNQISIE